MSGTIYDFIINQGASAELKMKYMLFRQGPYYAVVRKMPLRSTFVFDYYFSSYWLLHWLSKKPMYAASTRKDRFSKQPFTEL